MTGVAVALTLALLSAPTTGETQLYLERQAPAEQGAAAGDVQLRRGFAGPVPRTGEAPDTAPDVAAAGICALVAATALAARERDGPRQDG